MLNRQLARIAVAVPGVVALLAVHAAGASAATDAPVNDDLAGALPVGALPFANGQDLSTATVQEGEPSSCFETDRTVWYSYTPAETGMVTAHAGPDHLGVAVYTGDSLDTLAEVTCRPTYSGTPVTFEARAGTTYRFRVGANYAEQATFRLDVAPPPEVGFDVAEVEWSVFDEVAFWPRLFDPAGLGIDLGSLVWDFGDGTTSTEQFPRHRFASDGDHAVRLTARTVDGRTASATHTSVVRTHDVAVVKVNAPSTARAGQRVGVTVEVRNTRYDETVEIRLERSHPWGFEQVDAATKPVPATAGGGRTSFSFAYTVTPQDAAAGKVTFRAVAAVRDHRDALPADNELLSAPVRIR
ncbi:PKD domain-containing protein [Micromonospora sp. WMMC241]|uniref:PKD domain-containing protein n=1 Tax=Micromonospora sp. WMMC241 TaxID=3015159 RepID=UPI0022B71BE6|nr:PKD domain-containing protein [Micromonospora sp. WMMC241]MCZ7437334.1 PKD domain-containing protein [Micromonospora sp. WMMC241]